MERINKEQRGYIRSLHYRNEDLFDKGLIEYDEYIHNNYLLLRQVRYTTLTDEQKIILTESISAKVSLEKFRLGISIVQIVFN